MPEQAFFTKENFLMNERHKRCSTSLLIWETQIKTMIRYLYAPTRMSKTENTKC